MKLWTGKDLRSWSRPRSHLYMCVLLFLSFSWSISIVNELKYVSVKPLWFSMVSEAWDWMDLEGGNPNTYIHSAVGWGKGDLVNPTFAIAFWPIIKAAAGLMGQKSLNYNYKCQLLFKFQSCNYWHGLHDTIWCIVKTMIGMGLTGDFFPMLSRLNLDVLTSQWIIHQHFTWK